MEKASGPLSEGEKSKKENYKHISKFTSSPTCDRGNIIISDETFSTSLNIKNTEKCQEIKIQSCKFTNIKVKTEEKSIIYIKTSGIFISDSEFDQCFCDSSSVQIKSHCLYLDSIKNEGCNITNCKFINNGKLISDQEPGTTHDLSTIIYSSGTTIIRIINSEFTSNENIITQAININNNDEIELDSTTFSKYYGSVFIENINTCKIRNCTFDNNKMNENIKIQEGLSSDEISSSLYLKVNDHFTFINNTIQNHQDYLSCCIIINKNGASEQNNIITIQEDIFNDELQTVLIQECNFYNNKCTNNFEGGSIGLVIKSNPGEIENIDFIDCTFTKNGDKSKESIAGVFGLSNQTPILTFNNCIFESNEANEKSSLLNIKNGKILNIYNCKINLEGESGFLHFSSRSTNDKANITISSTTFNNMNKQNKRQTLTDLISIDDSTTNSQLDNLNIIDCTFKDISMNEEAFLFNVNSDSLQFVDNTISISTDSKNNNLFHFKNPKMNQIIINSCNLNNGLVSLSSTKSTQTIFRDTVYENHVSVTEQSILCSTTEEFICEGCSFIYTQTHSSTNCYRAILIKQSSSATITNCIFKNCWGPTELDGHGICCINPNSAGNVLTISSCIFEECGNSKSVVYSENNEINYINNTITFGSQENGATGLLINNICELLVDDCKFEKCKPTKDEGHQGGGIEYRSPSVDSPKESITIQNSEFISCDGRACAISLMPKHAHPTITNVTISNSKTCYYTLMIMITTTSKYSTEGEVIIQNTTFSDITNLENICGSGIWYSTTSSNNDKLSIIDCNFVNTYAYGVNNNVQRSGGAIAIESEECSNYHVLITGCSFYNCITVLYPGGGIAIQTHKTVTITNCNFNKTISNNNMGNRINLGAVCCVKYFALSGPCEMTNLTISDGNTVGPGPGIDFQTDKPNPFLLKNVTLSSLSSTSGSHNLRSLITVDENVSYFECVNSTFDQSQLTKDYTRAIIIRNLHYLIDHCNFINNGNPNNLNYRAIQSNNPSTEVVDITISHCTFTNCKGAYTVSCENRILNFINNTIYMKNTGVTKGLFVSVSCKLVVDQCNFTNLGINNQDYAFGGALFYRATPQREEIKLSNCVFDNCIADNSGAVRLKMYSSVPIFYNNTFKNIYSNFITSFIYEDTIIFKAFTVEKISFINCSNSASECGGCGLWINNARLDDNVYRTIIDFIDCNFINNSSPYPGGGFGLGNSQSVKPTTLQFIRCQFIGNSIINDLSKDYKTDGGGALWLRTSTPCTITDCLFKDNNAYNNNVSPGGAIFLSFTSNLFQMDISNTAFVNNSCPNSASLGHAIYAQTFNAPIIITNCSFDDNGYDNKNKNAVINTGSLLHVKDSNFSFSKKGISNSRAIYIEKPAEFIFHNNFVCNFTYNDAEGASIYYNLPNTRDSNPLEVINCTFAYNSAKNCEDLFLKVYNDPILKNCTFINNDIKNDLIVVYFADTITSTPAPTKSTVILDQMNCIDCSFNGNKLLSIQNSAKEFIMNEINLIECKLIRNKDLAFITVNDPKLTIDGSLYQENIINDNIFVIKSGKETSITNSVFKGNQYITTKGNNADEIGSFIIEKSTELTISDTIFEEEINKVVNNDEAHGFILKVNTNMALLNVSFINCSTFKYAIFLSDSFGNEINNQENEEEKTITSIFSFTNSTSDNSGCIFIDKRLNKVIVFNSTLRNTINGFIYYPTTESNNEMSEFVEIESSTFESINNNSCHAILNGEINIRNNTIRKCSNSKGKGNANFCFYVHNKTKKEFNIEEFTFEDNINENLEENNNRWMNGGGIGFVLEILSIQKQQSSLSNGEISKTVDASNIVLNFASCRFINNRATGNGGAFAFFDDSDLTKLTIKFYDCEFEGNKCDQKEGNALFIDCDKIIIEKCTFKSHVNEESGIDIENSVIHLHNLYHSEVMISESGFHDNEGMLLYIHNCSTEVTIKDSNIENNYATSNEISIIDIRTENEIHIVNNTFSHNEGYTLNLTANENVNIDDCKFEGNMINRDKPPIEQPASLLENKNEVQQHYCIIVNNEKSLKMNKCTFNDLSGGAASSKVKEDISIYGCQFENKITEEDDSTTQNNEIATINVEENRGMISFEDCKFYDIKTTSIKTSENTNNLSIKDVLIERRSSFETQPSYSIDISSQQEFIISFSKIIGSGGIYFNSNHKITESININNIEIENNKYGIILHPKANSNIGLKIFRFENFTLRKVQRAIDLKTIDYQIFIDRGRVEECNNELFKALEGEESTHGIVEITLCENSIHNTIILENAEFVNNKYSSSKTNSRSKGGGGIGFVITSESTNKECLFGLQMNNCKFISNIAQQSTTKLKSQNCGGVFSYSDEESNNEILLSSLIFTKCEFNKNIANNKGGSLYIKGGEKLETVKINDVTFNQNSANEQGGCIFIDTTETSSTDISITDCTLENNYVNGNYGCIYIRNKGDINLESCIIMNNFALAKIGEEVEPTGDCGGLCINSYDGPNKIILNDCRFELNGADLNCAGAFIWMQDKTTELNMIDCIFMNNGAENECGAMHILCETTVPSTVSVSSCLFMGNVATIDHDTFLLNSTNIDTIITAYYCTFQYAYADQKSGEINVFCKGDLFIDSCEFIENSIIELSTPPTKRDEFDFRCLYCIIVNSSRCLTLNKCRFNHGIDAAIVLSAKENANVIGCDYTSQSPNTNNPMLEFAAITFDKNDGLINVEKCNFYDMKSPIFKTSENTNSVSVKDIRIDRRSSFETQPPHSIDISCRKEFIGSFIKIIGSGGIYVNSGDTSAESVNLNNIEMENNKYGIILHPQANSEIDLKTFRLENFTLKKVQRAIDLKIINYQIFIDRGRIEDCNNELFEIEDDEINHGIIELTICENSIIDNMIFYNAEFVNNKCYYGGGLGLIIRTEEGINNDCLFGLELQTCKFISNKALDYFGENSGGGFYYLNEEELYNFAVLKSIVFNECEFINNNAENQAGSIFIQGSKKLEKIEITECNFTSNSANDEAGSIYIDTKNAQNNKNGLTFTIKDCIFDQNKAETNYGAIFIKLNEQNSSLFISDCSFINNFANKNSGALYIESNSVSDSNSISVTNCIFEQNRAKKNYGAIYIKNNGIVSIDTCQFIMNIASSITKLEQIVENITELDKIEGICGSLYIEGIDKFSSLSLIDCVFNQNKAGLKNGAIYINSDSAINAPKVTISGCFVINNTARSDFGGIFIKNKGELIIDNSSFINNTASLTTLTKTDASGEHAEIKGSCGALSIDDFSNSSKITISNSIFEKNNAENNYGAIMINSTDKSSQINIRNLSITLNFCKGDFGGIYLNSKGDVSIEICNFVNNTANKTNSLSINPTDALYIEGCGNWRIKETNFTKSSKIDENTNFQISIIAPIENEINVLFEFCMVSIINPTNSQIYIKNTNNKGKINFYYSYFSCFYTSEITDNTRIHRPEANASNYNHIYVSNECIGSINVTNSCFDTNEHLLVFDRSKSTSSSSSSSSQKNQDDIQNNFVISENLSLYFNNNLIHEECPYPEIIEELAKDIGDLQVRITPTLPPIIKKSNKKQNIIIGLSIGGACLIAIIIVAAVLIKRKRDRDYLKNNSNYEDNSEELCQETVDAINIKYDKAWSSYVNQSGSQKQNIVSRDALETNQDSSSDENTFEESKWDDLV